jgi:Holliday junction resolvase RusA-like endonuclease
MLMDESVPDYFTRKFVVDLAPIKATHQSALRVMRRKDGTSFVGKYDKGPVKRWMEDFERLASIHKPDKPFDGPLELTLWFGFPLILSDKGQTGPMPTRPDFDNLAKSVCDSLTKCGFWHDDSQVVFGKVMKFRTPKPFIGISIGQCKLLDELYIETVRHFLTDARK